MKFQKETIPVIPSKNVIIGAAKAPVTLTEFGDYESEACAKAHVVVRQLLESFEGRLNFVFRHFPLTRIHQKAHKAAEAAMAAAQEGKFWELHNELFANRHSLGVISLKSHAREAGVQSKKFLDELLNSTYGLYVQDDLKEGLRLGVTEVPAFFINGNRFVGEPTYQNLSAQIKNLLKETGWQPKPVKKAA